MEESELIQGIINKKEECFIKLLNIYKKKVMSLCYSYTDDYFEAEDLSQEIFLSVYKNMHSFRGESSLSTYIYKIALSKCVDFKRKHSIRNFLSGLIHEDRDRQDYDNDEKNYIRQTIAKLPEEQKNVVILYYYIGLTQKEIGEILKITEKAVEGRIYRARQKLRSEFEKEASFEWKKNGTI